MAKNFSSPKANAFEYFKMRFEHLPMRVRERGRSESDRGRGRDRGREVEEKRERDTTAFI